jgi:hypothetical protein
MNDCHLHLKKNDLNLSVAVCVSFNKKQQK